MYFEKSLTKFIHLAETEIQNAQDRKSKVTTYFSSKSEGCDVYSQELMNASCEYVLHLWQT